MSSLKKNLPSPIDAALFVFGLCVLGILIFHSYEMIAVFIETIAEEVRTVDSEIMQAGMAGN